MSNLTGKGIFDIYEAYQNIYTSQEVDEATAMAKRGYDETKLRKRAGGGEAADRATSLEDRPTYGDKSKEAQRSRYARAQRGDFRKTASSNPGLHVGQHKSNDPAVKAKQAARGAQRGALTPNERKQLNMGYEPEGEMSEAWYSGKGTYRTTASGHKVRWDEDEKTDDAVNAMLNKQRQKKVAAAGRERLKAKGKVPTKDGKPVFEEVVEFLYVEGYADSIEAAELMAESAAEAWIDMILEKDETEIGITGQPIPKKKLSPANRYEFEKKRRENLKKKPGDPAGDSKLTQALRQRAKDTGNYAESYDEIDEAKVDWVNRDKQNVTDRIKVLRDRNKRLQSDHPEVPSGSYQTDFRRARHKEARGKKS